MNSQSNEYPSIIQKLDKNTFAFNYNVQEQVNENNEVYWKEVNEYGARHSLALFFT